MVRIFHAILKVVLLLALAVASLWSALAIHFQFPGSELVGTLLAVLVGGIGSVVSLAQFGKRRYTALLVFVLMFTGVLAWWSTIQPPINRNWAPDVARQVTGTIDGDILTLTDVRDFEWRTPEEFTPNWIEKRYDLSELQSLDMFMSYWSGPVMAHFILSFGFADGQYLAWSVEVRRVVGGGFSPVADFFKTNTLVLVAATETDLVGTRSNARGEDVQLYRLNTSPELTRKLLEEYVRDANSLAAEPRFYNSIFANCSTVVFQLVRAIGGDAGFDWRQVVNGYLPEYAYDRGVVNTDITIEELRARSHIGEHAVENGLNSGFSAAIRAGAPKP